MQDESVKRAAVDIDRVCQNAADILYRSGWRDMAGRWITVYIHDDQPAHACPTLPDEAWLAALRQAGWSPLPCLACYQRGDGEDCQRGVCRGSGGLVLPPSVTWNAPRS